MLFKFKKIHFSLCFYSYYLMFLIFFPIFNETHNNWISAKLWAYNQFQPNGVEATSTKSDLIPPIQSKFEYFPSLQPAIHDWHVTDYKQISHTTVPKSLIFHQIVGEIQFQSNWLNHNYNTLNHFLKKQ